MSGQGTELTAYCGLYCGDCIRYRSKAADLARDLRRELQNVGFDKYAEVKSLFVKELLHYGECCRVLEAISELQCNTGCRYGGCPTFSHKIVECCQTRGLEGCWECDEFEKCKEFEFLEPFHGDTPLRNLRKIKELGLDKWVEHRYKFYQWL